MTIPSSSPTNYSPSHPATHDPAMRWPTLWRSSPEDESRPAKPAAQTPGEVLDSVLDTVKPASCPQDPDASLWRFYLDPRTLLSTVVLTTACIGGYRFYRTFLRRIPAAVNIKPSLFRKRSIFGKVTSVGDGDNFRIYHTPGGCLAGWGFWRHVPIDKKVLKNNTIHVRLAGIDAPEAAHFGRPSQPYSQEALDWLTSYVLGRRVRAYLHRPDQYGRVVATVYVRQGLLRRDVSLQMLRAGLAMIYEAKNGAEFGNREERYRKAEWWAKMKRKGMWAGRRKGFESPREYKARYRSVTSEPEGSGTDSK